MQQDCDIIIIGGGLAGLTCAIHLLQSGLTVLLIEKSNYPKHKVCGEYVSNEVLSYMQSLGIDPIKEGAKEITRFQFSGLSGTELSITLPLGGFGISRYTLDLLLYTKAMSLGLWFEEDTVVDITYGRDQFEVATRTKSFRAPYAIGAYGKRSNLDISLSRKFISRKSEWLGVKAHYKADFRDDTVALHNFSGGYCGLSKVETDAVNVCYLADYRTFKKYKDLEVYQKQVLEKNRYLQDFFDRAQPIFDKPLTISQVSFQNKTTVENHMLMVGDSAGLIHPLCGNGMAMAIHSAKIASECLVKHLNAPISRDHLENSYRSQWKSTFTKRMKNGSLIQRGLRNKSITSLGVGVLQKSPSLLKRVIQSTHGKTII